MVFVTGPLCSGKRTFAQKLGGRQVYDVQDLAADAADLNRLADELADYDVVTAAEVGGDDAKIVVLNRKAGSGTRATFEAAVFGDEAVDFKGDAELDKSGDVQTQMGSTDNAISYLDFSHFDDSKFNAIKVEGVEPKSKNVTDDSFKIWATEHMYCAKDADEATKAFLELMLSDDVQGKLVEEQGFIPVSAMKVVKDASGKVSAK